MRNRMDKFFLIGIPWYSVTHVPNPSASYGTKNCFFGVSAVLAQQYNPVNSPALPFQMDSAGSGQVPSVFPVADGCTERSYSALYDPEVLAIRQNQLRLPSPRMRHVGGGTGLFDQQGVNPRAVNLQSKNCANSSNDSRHDLTVESTFDRPKFSSIAWAFRYRLNQHL